VIEVYRVTREYPPDERFGLVSQTRRAATSVPANLAEACGKRSYAQLRHGADIASGSLSELEYWFLLARDLEYLTPEQHAAL
jgi:four helix bundle protein